MFELSYVDVLMTVFIFTGLLQGLKHSVVLA